MQAATLIEIRKATPDDASGIKRVQKLTWLTTYPNTEYGISLADIEDKTANWESDADIADLRQRIVDLPGHMYRLVAVHHGAVVGNCLVERGDDINKLTALYVLQEFQGKSVGHRLAAAGLEWLGASKDIALEVAKYNQHAINFYEQLGFEIAGEAHIEVSRLPSGAIIPNYEMVKKHG